MHPTEGRMSVTVIRQAAFALSPSRPIMFLASLARGRRSTAKSWATGHRRPSIETLKILCYLLKERRAVLYQLISELEDLIMLREREPPRARGFMLRDPLTGMDRRNRFGRLSARSDRGTRSISTLPPCGPAGGWSGAKSCEISN
jgi:hypothetical protein